LLESIVFRVKDNLKFSNFDGVVNIFADGGMTVNHRFMQVQADILRKNITVRERDTCWGVAKGVLTSCNEQLKGFEDQNVVTYAPQIENNAKL
jgi:glycerol kinase